MSEDPQDHDAGRVRSHCISKETSKDKKMDMQQERSVGGTSSLNGDQKKAAGQGEMERTIMCITSESWLNH